MDDSKDRSLKKPDSAWKIFLASWHIMWIVEIPLAIKTIFEDLAKLISPKN